MACQSIFRGKRCGCATTAVLFMVLTVGIVMFNITFFQHFSDGIQDAVLQPLLKITALAVPAVCGIISIVAHSKASSGAGCKFTAMMAVGFVFLMLANSAHDVIHHFSDATETTLDQVRIAATSVGGVGGGLMLLGSLLDVKPEPVNLEENEESEESLLKADPEPVQHYKPKMEALKLLSKENRAEFLNVKLAGNVGTTAFQLDIPPFTKDQFEAKPAEITKKVLEAFKEKNKYLKEQFTPNNTDDREREILYMESAIHAGIKEALPEEGKIGSQAFNKTEFKRVVEDWLKYNVKRRRLGAAARLASLMKSL